MLLQTWHPVAFTTVVATALSGCATPVSAAFGPAEPGPGPLGMPPGPLSCEDDENRPLVAEDVKAVERALLDERRSERMYEGAATTLEDAAPFPSMLVSQRRHGGELERILVAHGREVPPAPPPLDPRAPAERAAACALAASLERAKLALYDELLAKPLSEQVSCVFERLRHSSKMRQLPAFEACARGQDRPR